jgi:2-hydroxy-3-keto-5-methylthiopentenyl-1-phosphate phosphatase
VKPILRNWPKRFNFGAMAKPLTIFCDFDGTITEKDMVVTLCQKFCPNDWEPIVQDIVARKITVKEGVIALFAKIPSSKKAELIGYAHEVVRWRAGFKEFLEFCKANGLRFIVCSGGIDFFIEPLMAPFKPWIERIVSIPSDFSGPMIALRHNYACDSEGTCKVKVMAEYPNDTHLLIGDSITDLHGAQHADVVYARAKLKDYLDQDKISYTPFETFFDILKSFETFQGDPCPPHAHRKTPS